MTTASLPASTDNLRAAVVLFALSAFFSGMGLRICDGLIPRLASDFGVTPGVAGRVVLTFAVAYGISQLAFGPLGDRYGKARLVCVALFGCSIGALLCALAPGFSALLALRVIWGLAAAGIVPLAMAWIGDAVPYEQRQATLARILLGTLSGMMAGQLAGGLFADSQFGWRGAFLTLSAGYGTVGVLLATRLRHLAIAGSGSRGRIAFAAQLATVLREPWVRKVLAAVLAEGMFLLGPLAYFPSYLHQRFGLTLSAASALVAVYALGGLVYAAVARHLVQRVGERRMVWMGGVLMGAGFLALEITPIYWFAAPIALVLGFGTYLYHNTLQTHATQMAPAARGTAVALFAFAFFFGQAIGVSWAGPAFDRFGPLPLLLVPAIALPIAGWAFARALHRRSAGRILHGGVP